MRWIAALSCVLLGAAAVPTSLAAQIVTARPAPRFTPSPALATNTRSADSNLIRGWYRDYLGRDPGTELNSWTELLRGGMSQTDVQASILGSDEFYRQRGRDPQSLVRETLQAITWSEPTPTEVQRWTDRLAQLRGDNFALAREILLANAPASAPANQMGDLATRLASATRLAIETIEFEIGGTTQGRQATLQAQSLLEAANQMQQTIATVTYRPDDALASLTRADRAYQALQTTLSNPPGTAPSTAGIVRRLGTMLADARLTLRPTQPAPSIPTYPYPGNAGANTQQLIELVTSARRATDSLIQTLTSQSYQNYSYSVVLRDLDTLASRLANFDLSLRSGVPTDRLAWEVQSLNDIAGRVFTQLATGRMPYSVRLYWQSIDSSLGQIREAVGVGVGVGAGSPSTVLRPTPFHDNLLPYLDQAASQIDTFLAGINPLVFGIAEVPSVQTDARNLKNLVFTMRQQTANGESASVLKQTLGLMVGDYRAAYNRWNQIVASYRLANPARLSPVGESLNRVEQFINSALASGELSSAGPTRSTSQLSQLSSEINDARRSLASLAGYREQQSLDLYFEQLAGYIQSTNDALTRATTVDARRLAVGMQGVIGRMQAEIDSLNQRFASAGSRERQVVADLQFRVTRIGRLVDDLEASLY